MPRPGEQYTLMAETAGTSEKTWMILWAYRNGRASNRPKRRIPILKRLIADCDRLAADLEQEVRNEEHRVEIDDPTDLAYSTYAQAATNRRYNLDAPRRNSGPALSSEALLELGETPLGVRPD